jgi:hypothetical protein
VRPVTISGTTHELPVCNARVHICEVDALPRLILRLPDDIIRRIRDELLVEVRRPWPPIPDPDPGPIFEIDPGVIDPSPLAIAQMNMPAAARIANLRSKLDAVALNPQPLPPHESVVGAQLLENVLVSAIIIVGGRGADEGAAVLRAEIDDWCGTGWPRRWPRPTPPKGWDEGMVFTGAALAAATLAEQYDHAPELQEVLGAAAEQLAEAAVGR